MRIARMWIHMGSVRHVLRRIFIILGSAIIKQSERAHSYKGKTQKAAVTHRLNDKTACAKLNNPKFLTYILERLQTFIQVILRMRSGYHHTNSCLTLWHGWESQSHREDARVE